MLYAMITPILLLLPQMFMKCRYLDIPLHMYDTRYPYNRKAWRYAKYIQ